MMIERSPIEQVHLGFETQFYGGNSGTIKDAYKNKFGTKIYLDQVQYIAENPSPQIINVFGKDKSGKSHVAMKIAMDLLNALKENNFSYEIDYSWSFIEAPSEVKNNQILIIEPGEFYKLGHDYTDEYGVSLLASAINNTKSIVVLISRKRVEGINWGIECLGYDEKKNINEGILFTSKYAVGRVFLRLAHDVTMLERKSEEKKAFFLMSEIERILYNIDNTTKELLELLLIPEEIIFAKQKNELRESENAIIPQKIMVMGDIGSGKSTLLEILHALFLNYYGEKHVHAVLHENDLGILLQKGFNQNREKYIQFIAVEDATYGLIEDSSVSHEWINLRHIVNERTGGRRGKRSKGMQQGLVVAALCLHRITGKACPVSFRTSFDFQFFLDVPTNKWDANYVQGLFDSSIYFDFLKHVTQKRLEAKKKGNKQEYLKWLGMGVCIAKDRILPFRFHTDDYKATSIPLLPADSSWRKTWKKVVHYLLEKYHYYDECPPLYVIDNDITEYELQEYGRIRPVSEGGVNYRARVKNQVRSLWGLQFPRDKSIQPQKIQYDFSAAELSSTDPNEIMYLLLKGWATRNNLEETIEDYLVFTQRKNIGQYAAKKGKAVNTVRSNIKRAKQVLTLSNKGGIGFLWEQAIFILIYNLIKEKIGQPKIVVKSNDGAIIKETTDLILRDYVKHKHLVFELYPPATNQKNGPYPTFSLVRWNGGLGEVDFTVVSNTNTSDEDKNEVLIEAKASTNRDCDCVIKNEKLVQAFKDNGGLLLHYHPWETHAALLQKDPPTQSIKKTRGGRVVLEELLFSSSDK